MTPSSPVERHHVVRPVRRGPAAAPRRGTGASRRRGPRGRARDEDRRAAAGAVDPLRGRHRRPPAPGVEEARLDAVERRLGLLDPAGGAGVVARRRRGRPGPDHLPHERPHHRSRRLGAADAWRTPCAARRARDRASAPRRRCCRCSPGTRSSSRCAWGPAGAVVEQVVLAEDGEGYQHSWRVGLDELPEHLGGLAAGGRALAARRARLGHRPLRPAGAAAGGTARLNPRPNASTANASTGRRRPPGRRPRGPGQTALRAARRRESSSARTIAV